MDATPLYGDAARYYQVDVTRDPHGRISYNILLNRKIFKGSSELLRRRDSAVGIATGYGLDD
jgi:hypothetical protein